MSAHISLATLEILKFIHSIIVSQTQISVLVNIRWGQYSVPDWWIDKIKHNLVKDGQDKWFYCMEDTND